MAILSSIYDHLFTQNDTIKIIYCLAWTVFHDGVWPDPFKPGDEDGADIFYSSFNVG